MRPITKNKQREIIKIIKNDANHKGELCHPVDPNLMCVIGGLAYAAGKSAYELRGMGNGEACEWVAKAYGLDYDIVADLMSINDRYQNTEKRRLRLIEEVRRWRVRKEPKRKTRKAKS
jgi:hypothetical protein